MKKTTKYWTIRMEVKNEDGTTRTEYRRIVAETITMALLPLNDAERASVTYMSGEEVEYVQ